MGENQQYGDTSPEQMEFFLKRAAKRYKAAKAAPPGCGKYIYLPSAKARRLGRAAGRFAKKYEFRILNETLPSSMGSRAFEEYRQYYSVLFHLLVHRVHRDTNDMEQALSRVCGRFERLLQRSENNRILKQVLEELLHDVVWMSTLAKSVKHVGGHRGGRARPSTWGPGEVYSCGHAHSVGFPGNGRSPRRLNDELEGW